MKIQNTNLLPKKFSDRGALTGKSSKIKLRFPGGFTKLTIFIAILFSLTKPSVVLASSSKSFVLPHTGYLSTRFSAYHPGIDIAIGLGMPIHPIIDGEVIKAETDLFGLGKYVEVAHENGFKSKYGHMGKVYVKVGDKVKQENILGEVGVTGNTSGPHTHLEITHNGNYIDPQTLLPEIPPMSNPTAQNTIKLL